MRVLVGAGLTALVFALSAPVTALAQAQSSCSWVGQQWTCYSYPGVQAPQNQLDMRAFPQYQNPIDVQRRSFEYQQERDAAARQAEQQRLEIDHQRMVNQRIENFGQTSKNVGALMEAGRCHDATMEALRGGSQALAQIVQTECKPK